MRKLISGLILIATLCAFQNKHSDILGKWIEKDNFQNPVIFEFKPLSYKITTRNYWDEKIYRLVQDTFYTNGFGEITKTVLKLKNDELFFYDIETDTLLSVLERYTFGNELDYFNAKKNTSIELPVTQYFHDGWNESFQNTLYADDKDGELAIYFNGKLHELNDTSYYSLHRKDWNRKCELFIDKDLKLSALNRIQIELRKAQMNKINYRVRNEQDSIICIARRLPLIKSIYSGPIPPSFPDNIETKQKSILIKITRNLLSVNGKPIQKKDLKRILKELIELDKKSIMMFSLSDQLDFDTYINYYTLIMNAYYELRNDWAMQNYNVSNYFDLDNEQIRIIRRKYPMSMKETIESEIIESQKNN